MQATTKPLKSILKPPTTNPPPAASSHTHHDTRTVADIQAARNREVALHHAHRIQARKDAEAAILANLESLLDFPRAPAAAPERPAARDVARFKELIRPFQPADYDSLVEERNVERKCGYALCPRATRQEHGPAGYRIFGFARGVPNEFRVGTKAELERWCSEACAKRALYVRVQLSETPAWQRVGVPDDVDLWPDVDRPQASRDEIAAELKRLDLGDERDAKAPDAREGRNAARLARERGEIGGVRGCLDANIVENEVRGAPSSTGDFRTLEGELERLHLSRAPSHGPHTQRHEEMDEPRSS